MRFSCVFLTHGIFENPLKLKANVFKPSFAIYGTKVKNPSKCLKTATNLIISRFLIFKINTLLDILLAGARHEVLGSSGEVAHCADEGGTRASG
jgi:hypothetical protein